MGKNRRCGVLLPVSSLPSKYGIGCFSKSAYESVGMSDYYNLKSVMTLSNAISQYSKTNSGLTSLISNSNFTIKV